MQIEVIGQDTQSTDAPRDMTPDEITQIRKVRRPDAVKLHRTWTNSTLRAAIERVDAARD